MAAQLHLAEDTFPLHFLLERLERLIDIVVTNENLHLAAYSCVPLRPADRSDMDAPLRDAKKRFRNGLPVPEEPRYTMARTSRETPIPRVFAAWRNI